MNSHACTSCQEVLWNQFPQELGPPGSNFAFLSTSLSFWKGYQHDVGIDFSEEKKSEDPDATIPRGAGGL